jgi:predicted Zn-dependent protease
MDRLYADHGNEGIHAEARALVAECLRAGNHGTAEYVQGQLVAHRPDDLAARHLYVRILLASGKRAAAEKDLRELLVERPSDGPAYEMLAALRRASGDPRGAMEVFGARLREHAGQAGALVARASIALWDLRDTAAARGEAAAMEAAAARPGSDPDVAAHLRAQASWVRGECDRMERERGLVQQREGLAGLLLAGSLLLAAALGLAAARATRPGAPSPAAGEGAGGGPTGS